MKNKFPTLKLPRLRLYQQIIACFVLIVFIPLVSVSVLIFNINQKALKKELTMFTEHTAEALYKDLETEISWQADQIRILGHYLGDTAQLSKNFNQSAQSIFQIASTYEAVALYDAEGKYQEVAYRNFPHLSPELRLPATLSPKDREMATTHKIRLSVLYPNTGDPQENTYYLRAIIPMERGPYAYYVILKRFPFLQQLIKDHTKNLHTGIYIVGSEGEILAGPPGVDFAKQVINKEEFSFLQRIPNGVTREFLQEGAPSEDTDGKKALEKVFVKMPDIGWGIIIESPYSVRQVFVKRARDQSLMMIIGSLVLILALTLFYTLGINRNFRQLIKAIKAMAEGNYARRIRLITNTTTPMEIVYLTGEFNRMARRMAEAWTNSQELNQELMRRNEQEAFLSQITKRLHGRLTVDEVGEVTCEALGSYLSTNTCSLVLDALETGPVQQKRAWVWTLTDQTVGQLSAQFPETVMRFPLEVGLPSEPDAGEAHAPEVLSGKEAWSQPLHVGNSLIQPIAYQSEQLGYLHLYRGPEIAPALSGEECHLVQLVANQVGVALHQAHQWQTIQEANEKLSKMDEFKSNLIDTVSHELRTPLTSIKGYTSRLLRYDDNLSGETRTKSLKVIKQQADRLSRMVEDLLVIPDLEKLNLRVFPDQVFLPELVERCVQFIQEKVHREIYITWPEQSPPSVLADPDRLDQVLLNLLDNAVKYSIPNTAIHLLVLPPDYASQRLTLVVSNDSPPIGATSLDSLFEKFKRIDDGLTRTTRGSGLGLFITKGLVEAMGGEIHLAYRNQRFEVRLSLPLYLDEGQGSPEEFKTEDLQQDVSLSTHL